MMWRIIQHLAVVSFLLSFTNTWADLAGKAVWITRIGFLIAAVVCMYIANKKTIPVDGHAPASGKQTWIMAGGIIVVALAAALLQTFF